MDYLHFAKMDYNVISFLLLTVWALNACELDSKASMDSYSCVLAGA